MAARVEVLELALVESNAACRFHVHALESARGVRLLDELVAVRGPSGVQDLLDELESAREEREVGALLELELAREERELGAPRAFRNIAYSPSLDPYCQVGPARCSDPNCFIQHCCYPYS